ncbi:MAG: zinc ribbon domain-containing protein [Peptococcaceae bacterium]|nr:zinc ribbon domain-containing protein [Peptococcaceae bacterium]
MPIYEMRCHACRKKVELLVFRESSPQKLSCPSCGHHQMERIMSCFSYHRSTADRLACVDANRPSGADFYRDERNIGLRSLKRLNDLGCEPGIADFENMVERARQYVKEELQK